MSLKILVDALAAEYKKDPRNKIFVTEEILLSSVAEEIGEAITLEQLREVISAFLSGDMDENLESIYDAAVYSCSLSAQHCFNDDPEDEIDYEIDWLENDDGAYVAEIRPL